MNIVLGYGRGEPDGHPPLRYSRPARPVPVCPNTHHPHRISQIHNLQTAASSPSLPLPRIPRIPRLRILQSCPPPAQAKPRHTWHQSDLIRPNRAIFSKPCSVAGPHAFLRQTPEHVAVRQFSRSTTLPFHPPPLPTGKHPEASGSIRKHKNVFPSLDTNSPDLRPNHGPGVWTRKKIHPPPLSQCFPSICLAGS